MGHTLVLMRHGEAVQEAASDEQRTLTREGRHQARAAVVALRSAAPAVDGALVSAAVRTRQTWEVMAESAEWAVDPDLSTSLYSAGAESALDLVRLTDESVGTLLVIGHNPTIASLAQLLSDGAGDSDVQTALLRGGFGPASVAVLTSDGPWADLSFGGATLTAYHAG